MVHGGYFRSFQRSSFVIGSLTICGALRTILVQDFGPNSVPFAPSSVRLWYSEP